MTDDDPRRYVVRMWLWIAAVLALLVLIALFYFAPFRTIEPGPAPSPQSSEWTTAPEGAAVKVELPKTPVTSVPLEPTPTSSPAQ